MRTEEGNERAKEIRKEWNRENMKSVGANVKKETAERFREICEQRGTNPGAVIRMFILDAVASEDLGAVPAKYLGQPASLSIRPAVAERLKEFTAYAAGNPDKLAEKILTQWMDDQLELYGDKWGVRGEKLERMRGKK